MHPEKTMPRTAVVAGATGNVGAATATELARRGFHVVLLGRNYEKLNDRAQSCEAMLRKEDASFSGALLPVAVDLTSLASLEKARDEIRVQMHLASMEVQEEWQELEKKMEDFSDKAKQFAEEGNDGRLGGHQSKDNGVCMSNPICDAARPGLHYDM